MTYDNETGIAGWLEKGQKVCAECTRQMIRSEVPSMISALNWEAISAGRVPDQLVRYYRNTDWVIDMYHYILS